MKFCTRAILLGLLFTMCSNAKADYEAGQKAAINHNWPKAVEEYTASAQDGDVRAEYQLGLLYLHGVGVPRDDQKSQEWLGKATARGSVDAEKALASIYYSGRGAKRSYPKAFQYYKLCATQGEPFCLQQIATYLEYGYGATPIDMLSAYENYCLAARSDGKLGADGKARTETKIGSDGKVVGDQACLSWKKGMQLPGVEATVAGVDSVVDSDVNVMGDFTAWLVQKIDSDVQKKIVIADLTTARATPSVGGRDAAYAREVLGNESIIAATKQLWEEYGTLPSEEFGYKWMANVYYPALARGLQTFSDSDLRFIRQQAVYVDYVNDGCLVYDTDVFQRGEKKQIDLFREDLNAYFERLNYAVVVGVSSKGVLPKLDAEKYKKAKVSYYSRHSVAEVDAMENYGSLHAIGRSKEEKCLSDIAQWSLANTDGSESYINRYEVLRDVLLRTRPLEPVILKLN
ncbi:MAG: sel1 repeat family protein [Burkholderiales bacterium]|nr:sel1 repeat family protein [Burkholderiales bacterium]